ncbi:MAG TPA: creatininase family protein [Conexibacter sp.]
MARVRYHELLPHEILARRERFPVAFLPIGTLEWHADHAAVGLDGLKAERLCELAAEETGGFAFPTLWYGEPRAVKHMDAAAEESGAIREALRLGPAPPGDPDAEIAAFQALVRRIVQQLHASGMRVVCVLCGHHPLYDWAEPVVAALNREADGATALVGTEVHYGADPARAGGDHAGVWETSYLWHLRPDCVDLAVYERGGAVERPLGIVGEDPRGASPERGAVATAQTVAGMAGAARAALRALA